MNYFEHPIVECKRCSRPLWTDIICYCIKETPEQAKAHRAWVAANKKWIEENQEEVNLGPLR
jgi:hypothetical protein